MSEAFYCQTQDLAIGYGKTPLLQNIGIGVQRGQILALIGPNGAGKSTLLKTLAGQLAAQSGAVLLQGQNLTTYTPNARARKMALMLPHTRHTELTTCFDVAAAGRYPYTGRWASCPSRTGCRCGMLCIWCRRMSWPTGTYQNQ